MVWAGVEEEGRLDSGGSNVPEAINPMYICWIQDHSSSAAMSGSQIWSAARPAAATSAMVGRYSVHWIALDLKARTIVVVVLLVVVIPVKLK